MATFDLHSYAGLDRLGRIRLSKNFYLREFLYSEIAVHHGLRNVPDADRVEDAVYAGSRLCELLLEPLQQKFGRIHVRSGYRSRLVNATSVGKHNCAADNDGFHTWDFPHAKLGRGASACISISAVSDAILSGKVPLEAVAWWIHDHLPEWSCLEFFATPEYADTVFFNIGWHEKPLKSITSWRGGPRNLQSVLPAEAIRQDLELKLLRACGSDSLTMPRV